MQCSSCLTEIHDIKAHYKTEYHRYNIARKLVNLQPVSEELYTQKFQKIKEPLQKQPQIIHRCCGKEFKSTNTYQTHLNSSSHKNYQPKKHDVSVKSDSAMKNSKACLFCDELLESTELNLIHMQLHGFFIREIQCCIDVEGLLKSLAEQINKNWTCLHCFQSFSSPEATKSHMLDKGHCFMPQQEYKLLSKHYDFEEKLNAIIAQQKEIFGIEPSKQYMIKQDQNNNDQQENIENLSESDDEEWEDDDDLQNQKPQQSEDIEKRNKLKQQLKLLSLYKAKLNKNGEMLLPNGKIIGHRCYRRYYKQNHVPLPPLKERESHLLKDQVNEEGDIVAVDNNLITGYLRHYYKNSQNTNSHRQTLIAMNQNKIIRRWLRKSYYIKIIQSILSIREYSSVVEQQTADLQVVGASPTAPFFISTISFFLIALQINQLLNLSLKIIIMFSILQKVIAQQQSNWLQPNERRCDSC
ncbi:hypothetical protein pb186bvf_004030 [Paramecium bursaria]